MPEAKNAMSRDSALAGKDIENGGVKSPPRFRDFAIGNKAFVKDETGFDAVGPLALIVERIGGCQHSGAGDNLAGRRAKHLIKLAFFGLEVVFGVVGVEDVAGSVVNEVNVASGVGPSRVFIEVDFIGSDGHFRGADLGRAL